MGVQSDRDRQVVAVKTAERPSARDRLLAAADKLFYSEGVHVVGVDRIVERAGVTKASLYNTFGSKEELVRAYLEQHMRRRQERIARILTANHTPRARIVGIFAEVEELLAGSEFRGCRFISAAAEARPGDASEVVAAEYRAWLLSLLTDLAKAAGATDEVPLLGPQEQRELKPPVGFVIECRNDLLREDVGLDEAHATLYVIGVARARTFVW